MPHIWFDPGALAVSCGPVTVTLLAKEYALLKFLYDRRGQVFARAQLLDHVWPSQYPDERTVDDHVYRIRRKLVRLPQLAVVTVRGYGYSLRMAGGSEMPNPSVHDEETRTSIQGLFRKYHLFGQGRSILTLAAQQDALGIEVDDFYAVYMRFIRGDLAWLLDTAEASPGNRLYWVLLLYSYTAEPHAGLAMFERALALDAVTPEQKRELYILNIIDLYADTGQFERAEERLSVAREVVDRDGLTGFPAAVATAEFYVRVAKGDLSAERSMGELEEMLRDAPYLREIGRYRLVRAMFLLRSGKPKEASQAFDAGLLVVRQSQNVPLLLVSLKQLRYCLDLEPSAGHGGRGALGRKLDELEDELEREHGFHRRLADMEAMLDRHLR